LVQNNSLHSTKRFNSLFLVLFKILILASRQLTYDVSVILPGQSGFISIVPWTGSTLRSKTRSTLMAKGTYRLREIKYAQIAGAPLHPHMLRLRNCDTDSNKTCCRVHWSTQFWNTFSQHYLSQHATTHKLNNSSTDLICW
jgi:hypothetical protein